MKDNMKCLSVIVFTFLFSTLNAQFGIGFILGHDLYQKYENVEDGIANPSSGSAVLNLAAGPKIWVGGKKFSFSVESQANWGVFALSLEDRKGLGALSIPIVGRLNFAGLSCLDREGKVGFSLGGGIQYNRTELYGLTEEFIEKGVTRDYFPTYVIQATGGFGVSGFGMQLLVRYGFNPDNDASSLNIGIQYDMNRIMMKKIDDPNSAL